MTTKWTKIAVAVALFSTSASLRAQTTSESTSSTRSAMPILPSDLKLSLQIKNLDNSWQFVTTSSVVERKNEMPPISIPAAIDRALRVAPNIYLTQWQTVQSGAQSFLVAYRVEPLISLDFSEHSSAVSVTSSATAKFTQGFATRREFLDFLKTEADKRPLKLILLNLQNVNEFSGIEPYEIAQRDTILSFYILTSGFREVRNELDFQSQSNLKRLATAVLQYAQEYDEKLPPLQNIGVFKKAVFPYVRDNAIFVQPLTKKSYATNATMTNKGYATIQFASQIAVLYEAKVSSDGKRAVAFADGHVKRVSESEWAKIKKVSKIK